MRYLCFLVASVLSAAPPAATTTTLITDKANSLPLSDQFSLPATNFRLLPNGDFSFSTANNSAFFRWQKSTGVRTRLLQAGDPMPGVAQSMLWRMGAGLRNNSLGHLAMVNNFSHPGVSEPNAVFVYDGAFRLVAQAGDAVPGASAHVYVAFGIPFINDAGDVAFMAIHNPAGNLSGKGVFLYRAVGPPLKIARSGEPSPLGPNYSNIYNLIGLNNAGQIAFIADVDSVGPALFLYTPGTGVQALVRTGDPTPGVAGNFQLSTSAGLYFLNEAGQVAFASTVVNNSSGVFAGIWVAAPGATPQKVMAILDSTGASIGGNYAHSLGIFGFTPAGEVLYSCELANTPNSQALFLKSPTGPTQVVAARGQTAPGTGAQFQRVYPASVNSAGKVAFYSVLSGESNSYGLFLGGGASTATPIALQGSGTPLGGVYGLAGRSGLALQINDAGQVAFHADILGPNQTAIFFWPGSGVPRSIVSSADALPRGANQMLHLGTQDASGSTALFVAGYAGGKMTCFAKPLKSGVGQVRRISGEFDSVPGLGTVSSLGSMLINNVGDVAFSSGDIISNSAGYPSQGILLSRPSGALVKLALTGDALSDGSVLSGVSNIGARLNDGGQLAFTGPTVAPDGPAVLLASPSTLRLIAKRGQACGADVCDSFPVPPIVNSGGSVG
ncbi:MAG: hypothetical protein JNN08_26875, partial [Bryobacterales bacterium]|nr:hypothetical protein [Bryobacterales bacterium]